MTDEDYKRKLSAIHSAYVAGYSLIMGEDEVATVSTMKSHRNLITEIVKASKGRVSIHWVTTLWLRVEAL
jgi:hypothetical protein